MSNTKKQVFTTVSPGAADGEEAEMIVSTPEVDRDNDRLMPAGVDIRSYLKNPVMLWSHGKGEIPIGSATSLNVSEKNIRARWRWLQNDQLADRVKNAWAQGVIRAASVGFLPKKSKPNGLGGFDYTEWELLEISLVPLPANAAAVRALKSMLLVPETWTPPAAAFPRAAPAEPVYEIDPIELRREIRNALAPIIMQRTGRVI